MTDKPLSESRVERGFAYMFGNGVDKDPIKAFEHFSSAVAADDPGGYYGLSVCFLQGIGTEKNNSKAFELMQKAVEMGHVPALANLGTFFRDGIGTEPNPEKALEYFLRAAEHGSVAAQVNAASLLLSRSHSAEDAAQALRLYEASAQQGNAAAFGNLGRMYLQGIGVAVNHPKAVELFGRAVELGDVSCEYDLAQLLLSGHPEIDRDVSRALDLLESAAEKGDIHACAYMGLLVLQGEYVEKDPSLAANYLQYAADRGHPAAQRLLGSLYVEGEGVPKDPAKAADWWRSAVANGDPLAAFLLSRAYQAGRGVPKDEAEALRLLHVAADRGVGIAKLYLYYAFRSGLEGDREAALRLLHDAAEEGIADAQYWLGSEYTHRNDMSASISWFRKAAMQGHVEAQSRLGVIMLLSREYASNRKEAVDWLIKASAGGNEPAKIIVEVLRGEADPSKLRSIRYFLEQSEFFQLHLGNCFHDGIGFPQSTSEAAFWYRAAAERGSTDAAYNLSIMLGEGQTSPSYENEELDWVLKASSSQHPKAMKKLGVFHFFGEYVPQNIPEGLKLVRQADAMDPDPTYLPRILNLLRKEDLNGRVLCPQCTGEGVTEKGQCTGCDGIGCIPFN